MELFNEQEKLFNEDEKFMNEEEDARVFEWDMTVHITMTEGDALCPAIVDGELSMDNEYGYWSRSLAICSDIYYSTFRFNKSKMADVLKYIAENTPSGLEMYLQSLDGYEWISSEHSL